MIKSAHEYPIHTLLSHEGSVTYRVPAYQREYSWQKAHWEYLFQDLVEAEGAHFLGTIITLDQTVDALDKQILEVIDGQQRLTTLTLLLAAIYSVLKENYADLDEETRIDLFNLGRQLVKKDGEPRLTPQTQGHNLDDYRAVLFDAGFSIEFQKRPYFPMRRVAKCYRHFRDALARLAESEGTGDIKSALKMLEAVKQAMLVKIEVASHADAFVLFESLNNRGMPLTPVDLIKNHLLAESDRRGVMKVDEAFKRWNQMLTNLGDSYSNHERFLRHYYNAFRAELPPVANAPVATRTRLIRIYETMLATDIGQGVDALVAASAHYGRITGALETDEPNELDDAFRRLTRAQGAPSYVLVLWLMSKRAEKGWSEASIGQVVDQLVSFFVRRNLTGYPQTYALPKLFMTIIDHVDASPTSDVAELVAAQLAAVSSIDEEFRKRLEGPIYEENTDVARFILTTLSEEGHTKESAMDLWAQEKGHYIWTIEHVVPQGANLPDSWKQMLGGAEAAAKAQEADVHRLGNLTITAYNSTLSNKSFIDKRDRKDGKGNWIGYRNGLKLNETLAAKDSWTVADIEARTAELADLVIARFPLTV